MRVLHARHRRPAVGVAGRGRCRAIAPYATPCSPTCAGARAGRRSWRPTTRTGGRRRATSSGPRGGPPSRAAPPSASAPTWRSAAAASPTTWRPPTRSWPCEPPTGRGWWARRWPRPAPRPARCRVGAPPRALPWPIEPAARATGTRTLRTTWVEPALPRDRRLVVPARRRAGHALANGGAFGGKATSGGGGAARRLADEHGRAVRVVYTREDAVRSGPSGRRSRPGVRADGTGVIGWRAHAGHRRRDRRGRARTWSSRRSTCPGRRPRRPARGAGWVEAAVLLASLGPRDDDPQSPTVARRPARPSTRRDVSVTVRCGDPLDEVVLRSYCIGAAHMALGWVRSEGIAVDEAGRTARPHDSFLRDPAGRRHAADRGHDRGRRGRAGQRFRRRVRRGGCGGLAGRGHPEAWPARARCALRTLSGRLAEKCCQSLALRKCRPSPSRPRRRPAPRRRRRGSSAGSSLRAVDARGALGRIDLACP